MLSPDTLYQPSLYERTGWLATEFIRLSGVFAEAATKLETARASGDFSKMRSAALDIQTFADQAALLNDSLSNAIENETQRRVASC